MKTTHFIYILLIFAIQILDEWKLEMEQLNANFIKGAVQVEQFPYLGLPEVCFIGRSNVGKSTLINSIVRNKKIAKTSSTPGKTREINFFVVGDSWSFADLPGFGYAQASKNMRDSWTKLNYEYLQKRESLQLVNLLIDSRHDPMEIDLGLIEWLEFNQKLYMIILTKTDKIKPQEIEERHRQFTELTSRCAYCREVLPYSSINETGRKELIAIIKKVTSEK